ncbi:ATP-binding protein [Nannocystaceae bacterium ST9]
MAIPEPRDLGRRDAIEALGLEPGMIVWDRFCVVGKVRHATPVWSVAVTDLEREFGRAPHHRVTLQYLPIQGRELERLRRALAADDQIQPRVCAIVEPGKGVVLIHEPVEGEPLGANLPAREARALALALSTLLVRLHEARVRGVLVRASELRQSEGQFRLDGFDHLAAHESGEQDVVAMLALLRRLAGSQLGELLEPAPTGVVELWGRARDLVELHDRVVVTLAPHPPFVGREQVRRALAQAVSDAQIARSSVVVISGGQGVGKTRLLDEFASGLRRDARALVLRGEYLRGRGEGRGLLVALARLPQALAELTPEAGERARERMLRRTGALAGVLAGAVPALAESLGRPAEVPESAFEDGFTRQVAALTECLRSVGSQDRPLVVLLDNLQLADRGSLAILRRLLVEDRSHHTLIVAALCGPMPAELSEDVREGLLRDLQIEPLDAGELERMIVAGLPGPVARPAELAEVLHGSSRGNPLVAWAILQSWIERGVLTRGSEGEAWLLRQRKIAETSPEQVFGERIDQAGLDERALALLAAVVGSHVDEPWFERVAGWDAGRVAAAVALLERRGLIGRVGESSLRFAHELIRELVIERSAAGEVRRAHAAIANWLASLGPQVSAARLAYHTDRALGQESKGDPRLAEMHLAAGRELLGVYDLERSNWHFSRALAEPGDASGRLAAIEGAADVALLAGKCEDAAQLYAEAVVQAESPRVAVRIAVKAVHGLHRKSAASGAATIGRLALARADRPLPEGTLLRSLTLLGNYAGLGRERGEVHHDPELREQLGWLYARMTIVLAVSDSITTELCLVRARQLTEGLEGPAAANVLALQAARQALVGDLAGAKQLARQALELAERVRSDWTRGVVLHLRAVMIELPIGDYAQALHSLDAAVGYFRRTGDLSIGVSSNFFKVVYGRDREPLARLQGWLDDAAAFGESQGDTIVDLAIDALRLYLRARMGARNVVEAAANLSARALARELVTHEGYLSHAYLALALLEVGEPARAREQVELALARGALREPMPEFAYDLWVAAAMTLVRTRPTRTERSRLAKILRRLERAGRTSPRLAALARVIHLRQAMATGQRDEAREQAAALIAGQVEHGQIALALEAHRTLGELMRGTDVLAAREHVRVAQQLAEQLGLDRVHEFEVSGDEHDAPRPRRREPSTRRHSDAYLRAVARNELVDVAAMLEGSRARLLDTLGSLSWLYLHAEPELRVYGEQFELQSLLVHIALCARDSVDQPEQLRALATLEELDEKQAAAIPGASAGAWGRLAVTVVGGSSLAAGVTGGVSACRQVATRLGGFLELVQAEGSLTLSVYLPPERKQAGRRPPRISEGLARVLVLHPDPLLRETLATAISRLGHACESREGGDDPSTHAECDVVFADQPTLAMFETSPIHERVHLVEIASRSGMTTAEYPLLRVPFALGELRRHLEGRGRSTGSG